MDTTVPSSILAVAGLFLLPLMVYGFILVLGNLLTWRSGIWSLLVTGIVVRFYPYPGKPDWHDTLLSLVVVVLWVLVLRAIQKRRRNACPGCGSWSRENVTTTATMSPLNDVVKTTYIRCGNEKCGRTFAAKD